MLPPSNLTATSNDTSIDPVSFFVGLDVGELDGNTVALSRPVGASEGEAEEVGAKDMDGATETVGFELGCADKLGLPDGADVFDGGLDGSPDGTLSGPDGASEVETEDTKPVGCDDELGVPDGADVGLAVGVFDEELDGDLDGEEVPVVGLAGADGASEGGFEDDLVGIRDIDGATESTGFGLG